MAVRNEMYNFRFKNRVNGVLIGKLVQIFKFRIIFCVYFLVKLWLMIS